MIIQIIQWLYRSSGLHRKHLYPQSPLPAPLKHCFYFCFQLSVHVDLGAQMLVLSLKISNTNTLKWWNNSTGILEYPELSPSSPRLAVCPPHLCINTLSIWWQAGITYTRVSIPSLVISQKPTWQSYFIRSIDTTRIPGQQCREEKAVNRMLLSNNFPQGILGTQCKTHTSKWSYPTSRELGSLYINPPTVIVEGWRRRGRGSQLLSCVSVHAWGDWLVLVWGTSRALSGMGGPTVCSVLLCSCNTNYNPDTSWLSQSQHFGINFCIIFHNGITTHLVLS